MPVYEYRDIGAWGNLLSEVTGFCVVSGNKIDIEAEWKKLYFFSLPLVHWLLTTFVADEWKMEACVVIGSLNEVQSSST